MPPRRSTTERGLGWAHQKQVDYLKERHIDGSPCWWCGKPMFLDRRRNPDGESLAGDHSLARVNGGTKADRLLHGDCNKQRGDGSRDHLRPAVTGKAVAATVSDPVGRRLLPWPI